MVVQITGATAIPAVSCVRVLENQGFRLGCWSLVLLPSIFSEASSNFLDVAGCLVRRLPDRIRSPQIALAANRLSAGRSVIPHLPTKT
jgi:hypothetical protein